jgi:putative ABC transport system substrate-binding protein
MAGIAALVTSSRAARPQPVRKPVVIGYLGNTRPDSPDTQALMDAFRSEMQRLGWGEERRVAYEFRYAHGFVDRFPSLARELVALNVDVVFAVSTGAVRALEAATTTIPVVFVTPNPVEEGHIASLARPGSNLTGLGFLSAELYGKRLQLLKEAFPKVQRVAYLGYTNARLTREVQHAAQALQLDLLSSVADRAADLPAALAAAPQADAWLVGDHLSFFTARRTVVDIIAAQRKPAVYPQIAYVHAGGLMSYATDLRDLFRRAAIYVDKILRGAAPSELPVEQPTRFELVVNLKTAKALGLTIPQSLLLRADDIIQ